MRVVSLSMSTSSYFRPVSLFLNLNTLNSSRRVRLLNRRGRKLSSFRTFANVLVTRFSRLHIRFSRVSVGIFRRIRQKVHQAGVVRRRRGTSHVRFASNILRRKRIFHRNTFNSFRPRRAHISIVFIRRPTRRINRVRLISVRRKRIRKGQCRVTSFALPSTRRLDRRTPCRRVRVTSAPNSFRC